MKVTIIGAGNMGGALVKGFAKSVMSGSSNGVIDSLSDISVADHDSKVLENLSSRFSGIKTFIDNPEAVKGADVVILAVKPWLMETVVSEISSKLDLENQIIVSDAANITTDKLASYLPKSIAFMGAQLFYVIPNIAAEYCKSMTFISPGIGTTPESIEKVCKIYGLVGEVNVCSEQMVEPGMMIASCGIAYVMRYIRAQMEAGVEMGFYPNDAQQIVMQTMEGSIAILRESGLHPEAAIDKVTTPNGVSIRGLNEMEHSGFSSAVIRSLKAGLAPH